MKTYILFFLFKKIIDSEHESTVSWCDIQFVSLRAAVIRSIRALNVCVIQMDSKAPSLKPNQHPENETHESNDCYLGNAGDSKRTCCEERWSSAQIYVVSGDVIWTGRIRICSDAENGEGKNKLFIYLFKPIWYLRMLIVIQSEKKKKNPVKKKKKTGKNG